jgi:nicotinate-nucleotide adenylyltransferase
MATDAREALKLDRLIFVPAGAQPFKIDTPPVASGQDRLEMVRLAIADDANYVVDDAEINRKGLSFTVDTLEHLLERNPAAQLFLLLGEDVLAGFEQWRNPGRIRELATLAAVRRAGSSGSSVDPIDPIAPGVLTVSARRVDVSSSEIRERRRAGKSIKGFVPESVERFIDVRGLYR